MEKKDFLSNYYGDNTNLNGDKKLTINIMLLNVNVTCHSYSEYQFLLLMVLARAVTSQNSVSANTCALAACSSK